MTADAREGDDVQDPGVETDERGHEFEHGWRHRLRTHRVIGPFYKIVVLIIGLLLILAGIVMLVFPGPGWAAIILGLVVLAPDYKWAERLLEPIERLAKWAAARALDPKKRRQNLLILVALGVLAGLLAWAYLARYGLTYEPLPFL